MLQLHSSQECNSELSPVLLAQSTLDDTVQRHTQGLPSSGDHNHQIGPNPEVVLRFFLQIHLDRRLIRHLLAAIEFRSCQV